MISIISFARAGSARFPKKNTALLCGIPLIEYTLKTMNYIKGQIKCQTYVLTDYQDCIDSCWDHKIRPIWRPEYTREWDDIRLNEWAHNKIGSGYYVLLQPTNPIRDNKEMVKNIDLCHKKKWDSAYTVYNNKENGNFYWYSAKQLKKGVLKDRRSITLKDNNNFDIDYPSDLKRVEEYLCSLR